MARKSRRRPLNVALVNGFDPEHLFTEEQWSRIGGTFCELGHSDKQTLMNAVNAHLLFCKSERKVKHVEDAVAYIEPIKRAAEMLFAALICENDKNGKWVAHNIAVTQIARLLSSYLPFHFGRAVVSLSPNDIIAGSRFLLTACEQAINDFDCNPVRGIHVHDSWERFVSKLMDWAEERQPPLKVTIARKTDNSKNWPSPFVAFVERLSKELPVSDREFIGSENGLTDALSAARSRRRQALREISSSS
jgi:hypothetical protein